LRECARQTQRQQQDARGRQRLRRKRACREPQRDSRADHRDCDAAEEEIARDGVERNVQQHPERMGVDLHPLVDVPTQAMAVDEVVDDAERDEGVVADPSPGHHDAQHRGAGAQQHQPPRLHG
jgi:hypothetical protein